MKIKPKLSQVLTFLILIAQLCVSSSLYAQEDLYGKETLLKTIKIGPHPIYTRILVDLNKPVDYQFDANFREKKIILILPETKSGPKVHNKTFNDKNLKKTYLYCSFPLPGPQSVLVFCSKRLESWGAPPPPDPPFAKGCRAHLGTKLFLQSVPTK